MKSASEVIDLLLLRLVQLGTDLWYHPAIQILRKFCLLTAFLLAVFHVMLGAGVVIYGLFYYAYVPKAAYEWPVHLTQTGAEPLASIVPLSPYTGGPTHTPTSVLSARTGSFTATCHLLYSLEQAFELPTEATPLGTPFPALSGKSSETQQSAPPTAQPGPLAPSTAIVTSQAWHLAATAPHIHSIRRSAMIPYRSTMVDTLRKALLIVPLTLGLLTESDTVFIPLFEHFVDDLEAPVQYARIEVSAPRLQVQSARLIAKANMKGMAYWMYHWYISSFFVGVNAIAGTLTVLAFVVLIAVFQREATAFFSLEATPEAWQAEQPEALASKPRTVPEGLVLDPITNLFVLPAEESEAAAVGNESDTLLELTEPDERHELDLDGAAAAGVESHPTEASLRHRHPHVLQTP
ncbi:uncharacterized protein MONBRDRAFT_26410 [Monosiga brevicollis MX1]|uniref:Seipin n=1 Tax=Monosiga brevicollis TaxID=81824 RepID=A9V2A4_MONBE|nr:uncharacterized protein MONBRDRAFT_26410 [Monosiga brevicollis MX1]EDQ88224.1 predicted protein [Monosiga brevicollis MX1]|eukprot:XP_001746817.1 hypothetical protein [Monosiga brevicollis MX1]